MDRRVLPRVLALCAAVLALGFIAGAPALSADKGVAVNDNVYNPRSITITVGSTITWTDNGTNPHSVKSNSPQSESFDSSPGCRTTVTSCMKKGDKFPHKFTHTGTFTYYCEIHGAPNNTSCPMCGKVIVKSASTPPPTITPIRTPTPSPRRTVTPTTAPRTTPRPVVNTVSATQSPTPSPTPTAKPKKSPQTTLVQPSFTPLSSTVAFGEPQKSDRGPLIGIAVAAVGIAIGGGILVWYRLRGGV